MENKPNKESRRQGILGEFLAITPESCSIFITMPPSPSGLHIGQLKRTISFNESKIRAPSTPARNSQQKMVRSTSMNNKRFDSFKTWSGKLERQISNLRGIPQEPDIEADSPQTINSEHVPEVDRYLDALEGPELDTLRVCNFYVCP